MSRKKNAFSLIELVIVIVIIGMIAAIAVPRISRGAKGASASSLRMDLAVMRNAIELYAAEHNGDYPSAQGDGTNAKDTEAAFVAQLIKYSKPDGTVADTSANGFIYGPYLRRGIPPCPVGTNTGSAAADDVKVVTGATLTPDDSTGWLFSDTTGDIIANVPDALTDEDGTKYNTY